MANYPAAYQQLLETFKRNQMAQLPEAEKLLAAQQQARGIFTSPIAKYGMTDLYNKYMQNVAGQEANLGLQAAGAETQQNQFDVNKALQQQQMGQQESQFTRGLSSQEQQNQMNRDWQERIAYQQQLSDLTLAKKMANAQRNQMWTKLPFDLIQAYLPYSPLAKKTG